MIIKDRNIMTENNSIQILDDETNLVGEHNFFDIAVSYYICSEIYKISNEEFKTALRDFKGLAHRLEYVATKDSVSYYDDSISTIGETTIEGIKALKNVNTLILGGMDRQIDYSNLEDFIIQDENLENLILMPDTGTRIYKELQAKGNNKKCYLVNNLEEAVKKAKEVTKKNTICLLSPAAASYGFFKNFEERGNKFKELL
jgi:UDP-N-acetylmuramoylalanine-D-glutamate ligase